MAMMDDGRRRLSVLRMLRDPYGLRDLVGDVDLVDARTG